MLHQMWSFKIFSSLSKSDLIPPIQDPRPTYKWSHKRSICSGVVSCAASSMSWPRTPYIDPVIMEQSRRSPGPTRGHHFVPRACGIYHGFNISFGDGHKPRTSTVQPTELTTPNGLTKFLLVINEHQFLGTH
ncbi:hypothetical protein EVAR_56575_1 [Eumeta japonica]|uniref:Uncharacterized protein n=1 Tax=Eumeta variegata TaxID=151549 RepID=A0A4C1Z2V3_EUMVA|nr:hypothetical protein EVAR_56575_1 [Eumeta japonica]